MPPCDIGSPVPADALTPFEVQSVAGAVGILLDLPGVQVTEARVRALARLLRWRARVDGERGAYWSALYALAALGQERADGMPL